MLDKQEYRDINLKEYMGGLTIETKEEFYIANHVMAINRVFKPEIKFYKNAKNQYVGFRINNNDNKHYTIMFKGEYPSHVFCVRGQRTFLTFGFKGFHIWIYDNFRLDFGVYAYQLEELFEENKSIIINIPKLQEALKSFNFNIKDLQDSQSGCTYFKEDLLEDSKKESEKSKEESEKKEDFKVKDCEIENGKSSESEQIKEYGQDSKKELDNKKAKCNNTQTESSVMSTKTIIFIELLLLSIALIILIVFVCGYDLKSFLEGKKEEITSEVQLNENQVKESEVNENQVNENQNKIENINNIV